MYKKHIEKRRNIDISKYVDEKEKLNKTICI